MSDVLRVLWEELKGKMSSFNVLDTFWKIQMGCCLLFAAVIYSIKQNVKVATDAKVFFACVETQISGHIYQGKDCVTILPMHNENTNENTIFSFIASFFSPKPLPNKKTQDLKKRAKLMNYGSSVAVRSLGMSTVILLTSQEDRRRRQDIFLHNLLISAL